MIDRIFIQLYRPAWAVNLQVLISKHENEKVYVASEIVWKEATPAEICEPTLYLRKDEAQELMDSLWSNGLRPTEGSGSAGALAATQEHLKDMRKIAFDLLEKK